MTDDEAQERADVARSEWAAETPVPSLRSLLSVALLPGLAASIGVGETNMSAVAFADAVAGRALLTVFDVANRHALLAELESHDICSGCT